MQQAQRQPLYAAKDRVPFNLTLVLALGIAAWGAGSMFGLWDMGGNPQIIFILGIIVAIYTWLFTPREYLVFDNAVCVAYGRPRIKTIHFSNIAVVEMGSMATLDQLRIRPVRGRRQSIRVRDPETFFDELEAALNAYRNAHPEENVSYQMTGRHPPEVVEGQAVVSNDSTNDSDTVVAASQTAEVQDELVDSSEGNPEPASDPTDTEALEPPSEGSDTPEDGGKPPESGQRGFY